MGVPLVAILLLVLGSSALYFLEKRARAPLIETVRGTGYRLRSD